MMLFTKKSDFEVIFRKQASDSNKKIYKYTLLKWFAKKMSINNNNCVFMYLR